MISKSVKENDIHKCATILEYSEVCKVLSQKTTLELVLSDDVPKCIFLTVKYF